jgi:subfamily B ATP-binding cassette protein HlyB/CyaB
LIQKLTTIAILWTGAYLVIGEELSIGQLIAFNMLAGQVTGPLLRLVNLWQEFQQVGISVQRLGDILNTRPESALISRTALPQIVGQIRFEDVTFRYRPDGPAVLRNMTLTIPPGQVIGLIGRSGSGKSTIGKLLQRLYVPERGRVLIDGIDLAQIDPTRLRRKISVVLQDNFLFNGSVRDNIALADPGIPMERIIQAAQLAGAHEFILELPEGYDTRVGEHGCSLSGGQRQRIAIARALMADPRVLIFDEATSALDYESEAIIQQNMSLIAKGRTVIVIAHRLSTVRFTHRIFAIDKGNLIEDGTHEELLKKNGLYTQLHRHQEGRSAAA